MAGWALLAGYHRFMTSDYFTNIMVSISLPPNQSLNPANLGEYTWTNQVLIMQPQQNKACRGSLLLPWITLNPNMQKSSHANIVWDELTYPFPIFNCCIVQDWALTSNFIPHYNDCDYLSILGLKINPVSKRGPWGVCMFRGLQCRF